MIEIVQGNIFSAPVDALVNPVNCLGVSGAGLAAAFRRSYPYATGVYAAACRHGDVRPGKVLPVYIRADRTVTMIIYFPTKDRWWEPSQLSFVRSGLAALRVAIERKVPDLGFPDGIRSIAIPALGCGLGELLWNDVKPMIVELLAPCSEGRKILLYEPHGRSP